MISRGDISIDDLQPSLKEGWTTVPFLECLDDTGTYKKLKSKDYFESGDFPVIDQGEEFISGYIDDRDFLYTGSLPVVLFGDHTRTIKYVDFNFAVGADGVKVLKPKSFLDPQFFYFYLRAIKIPSLGYSRHYSLLKIINVPVPPLKEQKAIAHRLNDVFLHIDQLMDKLRRFPVFVKNLKESLLHRAVIGKLTDDWRKINSAIYSSEKSDISEMREVNANLPDTWKWLPFSRVATVDSNLVRPLEYMNLPLIAPDNVASETGKLLNMPRVSDIRPKSPKHYFKKGSIIYSKIRPYLSKVVIADFDGLCSADMYPISTTTLETRYLYYYMLSSVFLKYSTTAGERSVLPKINQAELSIIPVSVPPRFEQKEIVDRIDRLFSLVTALENRYEAISNELDKLPSLILKKTFKGELVQGNLNKESISSNIENVENLNSEKRTYKGFKFQPRKINRTQDLKNQPMSRADLVKVIENKFKDVEFSFEELNGYLKLLSRRDYTQMKKTFFELLRNDKLKLKEDRLVSKIDVPTGVVKYKLHKNENIKI